MKKAEYIERKAAEKAISKAAALDSDRHTRTWAKAECIVHSLPAADVEAARRWVSVKDALPEGKDCDGVLVVVSGKHKNTTFVQALELAEYTPGEGWYLDAYPEWKTPGITHWMPLPELPVG